MERPLALLSNDDGVASAGLAALADALNAAFDVVVVAPELEQSAMSHSLSLHRPLRLRALRPGVFAVDGTPADCVYVALHAGERVLPRRPSIVLSGINHGLNLGQDVFYSGTVAAAREGALRGIPAIAMSAHVHAQLDRVGGLAARLAASLLGEAREATGRRPTLLNVNVPAGWTGEVRSVRLGARIYEEVLDFRKDPRGRDYFWLGGPGVRHVADEGTDTDAYDACAASVTPLVLDLTAGSEAASALARRVAETATEPTVSRAATRAAATSHAMPERASTSTKHQEPR